MYNLPEMSQREYDENIAGIDYEEIEERKMRELDKQLQEEKENDRG